ncbi:transcriptional regulator, TetR family [bacterium A37T11]|nr:transcriptional regulator, TetR family [bacterium A37T11]
MRRKNTKQAFTDAYYRMLAEKGYAAIGVNGLAREAETQKNYYYRDFGSKDVLVMEHAKEYDYWCTCMDMINTDGLGKPEKADRLQEVIIAVLQNQLFDYYTDAALREMITHSLDKAMDPVQRAISDRRDAEGERLLQYSDQLFGKYGKHFRAMMGVLVGGTDFVALHARNNRSAICGLDPNDPRVFDLFLKLIAQLVVGAFQKLRKH